MLAFRFYPTRKPPPWTIRAPQKLFCWCYQTTAPRLTAITTNSAPDQRKSASVPLPNYYLLLLRYPFSSTSISTRARPRNIRHAYLPTPSQPRPSNRKKPRNNETPHPQLPHLRGKNVQNEPGILPLAPARDGTGNRGDGPQFGFFEEHTAESAVGGG